LLQEYIRILNDISYDERFCLYDILAKQ